MVLVKNNMHALRRTANLVKELGVRTFCATKALPNHAGSDRSFLLSNDEILWALNELVSIERDIGINVETLGCNPKCLLSGTDAYNRFYHSTCVAGKTTVTIGADGNVRPCSHIRESYGNIFEDELADI